MNGIAFNSDDLLEDDPEVLAFGVSAAEGSRHVLPAEPSGPNKQSWMSSLYVCISHLLCDPDLLHKKAGALAVQTSAGARDTEILARTAAADDIHRRQFRPVQFRNVPNMEHLGEMVLCDFDGKGFDLTGPQGFDPVPDRRQGEAADPVEQAPHGESSFPVLCHSQDIACATARVVLTAAWAV